MYPESALLAEALLRLKEVGHADILVGIPSYNNAQTIQHVVSTAAEGMVKYFPTLKPVIINSDGGSLDGTRAIAMQAPVPSGVPVIATEYQGPSGKGSAFRAIFEAAQILGAHVCIVLDSDLRSLTPQWIHHLANPVVEGAYDYVTPFYIRHKYDGTITNNIAYPMTRMLYGQDIRQPIGGDFGFSGDLARLYLSKQVWHTDVARYGIDIWMTTTAITSGARICQALLGVKIHDVKDPAASLGPMFTQVVGTLFHLMGVHESIWTGIHEVRPTRLLSTSMQGEPEPISVNWRAMVARLKNGAKKYGAFWSEILCAENLRAIQHIADLPEEEFTFPAERWARIVFDFAVTYNKGDLPHNEIVTAMTPIYYGRTASLVLESQDMDSQQFERDIVQTQARIFEELKPELLRKWRIGQES